MRRGASIFAVGVLLSLLIAVALSQFASGQPDGLEYVAGEQGLLESGEEHALSGLTFADYGEDDGGRLMLAGLVGTLATLGIGYGIFWLARSREQKTDK